MVIVHESLTVRVYKYLKEKILENEYKAGERLQENELAEQLEVSRTPIREAINRLGAEGLVTITPRRGVFVTDLSPKNIKDLYSIRESLEILALQLTLPNLSDEEIEELSEILEQFNDIKDAQDNSPLFDVDKEFHDYLIHKSGNSYLIEIYDKLGPSIQMTRMMRCDDASLIDTTYGEHKAIMDAIVSRDQEKASKLLAKHIRDVKDELISQVNDA